MEGINETIYPTRNSHGSCAEFIHSGGKEIIKYGTASIFGDSY